MRIVFLLTSNTISGGTFAVYRQASLLAEKGYEVTISFMIPDGMDNKGLYPGMDAVDFSYWEELKKNEDKPIDALISTWWETMYLTSEISARHYFYFVQGFEDEFYESGSRESNFVLQTYLEPVHFLTVSDSLARRLRCEFGHPSRIVGQSIDIDRFLTSKPAIPSHRGRLRVLVEGLPKEERKKVALTMEILSEFPELEIVYVSPFGKPQDDWPIDYFFQSIPYEQIPSIFKSCDFILKLSSTESFALPVLEIFATGGTAVVSAFKGHDEYIQHGKNALVVPINDKEAARSAVNKLVSEPELREKLRANAHKTALDYARRDSGNEIERAVLSANGECRGCNKLLRIKEKLADYLSYENSLLEYGKHKAINNGRPRDDTT